MEPSLQVELKDKKEIKETLEQASVKEDALHSMVRMIVSSYLKNNLDKENKPTSKHFALGLQKSIESGIEVKNTNSKDAKVDAFLKYLSKQQTSIDNENREIETHANSTEAPLRSLMHEIAEDYAIDISNPRKKEQLAEAVFQSEVDILIKRGQGGDVDSQGLSSWQNLGEEQQEKYRNDVEQKRNDQVRGIERWIKYVSSDEVIFPAWYKYFVITSLRSMGVEQFELGTYTYGGRTDKTLFRFPTLNPAVLAKVYDRMLSAYDEENRKKPNPTKYDIQDAFRSNIDDAEQLFLEKYAKEANFTQLYAYELSKYKEATLESKRSSEGVWVKYNQQKQGSQSLQSEAQKLSDSLLNKGTAWCTEQTSFSETQLAGGDFYVYYTREDMDKESHDVSLLNMTEEEKRKVCTMPRIAIKMQNGQIHELRGIVGGQDQDLEPEMLDIAREKCQGDKEKGEEPLPGREKYEKRAQDMKKLMTLIEKQEKSTVFSRDDVLFLYEVNGKIEGFGHDDDPRIEKLKAKRNRQEDIQILCNCPPEHIAKDFLDITETTQVYLEDIGTKITLFDFRDDANKEKLPHLIELAQKIKETGSPARPDMSFEGGIVNIEVDQEKFKDIASALQSYDQADNKSPSWAWPEWNNLKSEDFKTPESKLDVVILSYNNDPNIRKLSDKIVEDMDKLNLRPATFSELVALGIAKPEFNKISSRYLFGLGTKAFLDGYLHVPLLYWNGDKRCLTGDRWDYDWDEDDRFVCVRK